MKFSDQEIEFIKNNYIAFGLKFCGNKLNRSLSSVQKVATRLGLKVNKKLMTQNNPELLKHLRDHSKRVLKPISERNKIFPKEKHKEVIDLYLSGKSSIEISKIFECSKPVILRILKDIPKRKPGQYANHKSKNQFGENNPAWKGGIKDVYNRFRDLAEYYEWRKQVLDRDGSKCTSCEETNRLHSHHIKTLKTLVLEYSAKVNKIPKDLTREDLLNSHFYDLSNGLTLCEKCHKAWHKENGR
jgi:hypothetical protein